MKYLNEVGAPAAITQREGHTGGFFVFWGKKKRGIFQVRVHRYKSCDFAKTKFHLFRTTSFQTNRPTGGALGMTTVKLQINGDRRTKERTAAACFSVELLRLLIFLKVSSSEIIRGPLLPVLARFDPPLTGPWNFEQTIDNQNSSPRRPQAHLMQRDQGQRLPLSSVICSALHTTPAFLFWVESSGKLGLFYVEKRDDEKDMILTVWGVVAAWALAYPKGWFHRGLR